jgi:hypothetical protein
MPEAPAAARSKIVGRLTEDGDVQAGAVLRFSPISGETYDVKCVHGQQVHYAHTHTHTQGCEDQECRPPY